VCGIGVRPGLKSIDVTIRTHGLFDVGGGAMVRDHE
jgi:hypothetical protein